MISAFTNLHNIFGSNYRTKNLKLKGDTSPLYTYRGCDSVGHDTLNNITLPKYNNTAL